MYMAVRQRERAIFLSLIHILEDEEEDEDDSEFFDESSDDVLDEE